MGIPGIQFILLSREGEVYKVLITTAGIDMTIQIEVYLNSLYYVQYSDDIFNFFTFHFQIYSMHPPPAFGLSPSTELALGTNKLYVQDGNSAVSGNSLSFR